MEPIDFTEEDLAAFANAINNTNNNGISNNNVINLKTVNTSGPEWDIPIGDGPNNIIPANLRLARKGGKSRRKRRRRSNKRRLTRRRR
jgi:hypothetical protein